MPPGSYRPPPRNEQLHALLLAALCALLFLGKSVWPGYALVPFPPEAHEPLLQEALARGMPLEQILVGNSSLGDKYNQSLAWDRIQQDALRAGSLRLWSREIGGGAPFVPQMGQIYQPWNLLLLAIPAAGIYGLWFLLHQVVFGWLAYRFFRRIGLAHASALVGLVCAVLGLWLQARVHHNVIVSAALPCFGILAAVHALVQHGERAPAVGRLALGLGIAWLGGFPPTALQETLLALAYAGVLACSAPKQERVARLLRVAIGVGLGGALAAAQMVPVLLAAAESSRTAADSPQLLHLLHARALQPAHLLGAIWPDLLHWPAETFYGRIDAVRYAWAALGLTPTVMQAEFNFAETAFGISVPGLAFALLGLAARPRREALFFGGALLLGIGLASAWPGFSGATRLLPGGRAGDLKRYLFTAAIALAVLAALGCERWRARGPGRLVPALVAAVLAASAALLTLHLRDARGVQELYAQWLAPLHGATAEMFHAGVAQSPSEAAANTAHLRATFARAAISAALTLGVLFWRGRWSLGIGIGVIALELLHAGSGTRIAVDRRRVETPPQVLQPVLADPAGGRLQRLCAPADQGRRSPYLPPNLAAYYGIADLAAYNPQPKQRMEQLFLALEPDEPGKASVVFGGAGVNLLRKPASATHRLLDLLACRWLLTGGPVAASGLVDRTPAGVPPPHRLYERTTAMPLATFVTRARVVPAATERLALLGSPAHDPSSTIVLEDLRAPTPPPLASAEAEAAILWTARESERSALRVRTKAAGYLRLADPYDAGWVATVDGKVTPIHCVDHYLQGVYLRPGEHEVELRYAAWFVRAPQHLSLVALLVSLWLVRRKKSDR